MLWEIILSEICILLRRQNDNHTEGCIWGFLGGLTPHNFFLKLMNLIYETKLTIIIYHVSQIII